MKNEIRYNKTVQILEDAYMNDTLMHGNCCACAVGNIIAANNNMKVELFPLGSLKILFEAEFNAYWIHPQMGSINPSWGDVFCTRDTFQEQFPSHYIGKVKKEIDSSGYQWQDLAAIEKAFETASIGESDDEWMFNGLMAVIDALDIIHENTDLLAIASTKNKFIKPLNTPTCTTLNYDTK